MSSFKRVLHLHWIVPLLAALLTLNCAPDEEGAGEVWRCPVEQLVEGQYSFSVDDVSDGCGVEQLDGSIRGDYPHVHLPDFGEDLDYQTRMQLPLVGSQDVHLSLGGDSIQISLAGQEEAVLVYGGCQLRFGVNGSLCPATVNEIDVQLRFTFVDATELTPGACDSFSFKAGCTVKAGSLCRRCQ